MSSTTTETMQRRTGLSRVNKSTAASKPAMETIKEENHSTSEISDRDELIRSIKVVIFNLAMLLTVLTTIEIVSCLYVATLSSLNLPGYKFFITVGLCAVLSFFFLFISLGGKDSNVQRYKLLFGLGITLLAGGLYRAYLQGSNYTFLLTLDACADHTLTTITGNTSQYYRAYLCEIEIAAKAHSCSCVNKDHQCQHFYSTSISACAGFINTFPLLIYVSYFVAILSVVASIVLSAMCVVAWRTISSPADDKRVGKLSRKNSWSLTSIVFLLLLLGSAVYLISTGLMPAHDIHAVIIHYL